MLKSNKKSTVFQLNRAYGVVFWLKVCALSDFQVDMTLCLSSETTKSLMNNVPFPSKGKMNRHLQGVVEIHSYLFLDIFH